MVYQSPAQTYFYIFLPKGHVRRHWCFSGDVCDAPFVCAPFGHSEFLCSWRLAWVCTRESFCTETSSNSNMNMPWTRSFNTQDWFGFTCWYPWILKWLMFFALWALSLDHAYYIYTHIHTCMFISIDTHAYVYHIFNYVIIHKYIDMRHIFWSHQMCRAKTT